ncbi:hypothetical protein [Jannaschia sp. W003]|uniref:hypothetical protein n=1 Tax=Jannaschia sp. W003 TaxID=2867012 RepID=UPI0021A5AEEB|nr:hypothetical protein [Jannaschia sp. W003]UWQ21557.1 hypothetical protein K3554_00530 [Jannaschia sp. W003]
MTGSARGFDLALAAAVTVLGAALAWGLVGGLPLIGIDDASITRSYSENIAAGHGYVYNVGGERVEGSTTLLWALGVAGLYLLTSAPEILIVTACAALAWGAVFCALRTARHLAEAEGGHGSVAAGTVAAFLVAAPGYFAWAVWTMMELALWSALIAWLVLTLVRGALGAAAPLGPLLAAALLLPLARPEGVAVAVGLLALALIVAPGGRGRIAAAIGAALVSFAAVTAWRLSYFGQPFPNTFYAKVSSDRMQDLTDGAKYTLGFLLGSPFAELLFVAWIAGAAWIAVRWLRDRRRGAALLIPAAAVFGFLAIYSALGGDHFALWRFFQPIQPLLPVAAAVGLAVAVGRAAPGPRALALPAAAAVAGLALVGWPHYHQARFDLRKEFVLNAQGIDFGTFLDGVAPRPSVGVGPAGGIALSYDGHIYDLLGLNWTEMAHAKPIKVGMRNHASFDKATFWAHEPEVVAIFNRPCGEGDTQPFWASNDDAFDDLFEDPRFRSGYRPVRFREAGACWPAFARPDWLRAVGSDPAVEVLEWTAVELIN